jgi:hypothetical protein
MLLPVIRLPLSHVDEKVKEREAESCPDGPIFGLVFVPLSDEIRIQIK